MSMYTPSVEFDSPKGRSLSKDKSESKKNWLDRHGSVPIDWKRDDISISSYLTGKVHVPKTKKDVTRKSNTATECCESVSIASNQEYHELGGSIGQHENWQAKMMYSNRTYGSTSEDPKRTRYISLLSKFERAWAALIPIIVNYHDGDDEDSHSLQFLVPPLHYHHIINIDYQSQLVSNLNLNEIKANPLSEIQSSLKLVICVGGKDQLALDWLQTIAKLLSEEYSHSVKSALLAQIQNKNLDDRMCYDALTNTKTAYLLFEYPGYGISKHGVTFSRENIRAGIYESIKQVMGKCPGINIELHYLGYSLGSSFVLDSARDILDRNISNVDLKTVTLVAPFDTLINVASSQRILNILGKSMVKRIMHSNLQWDNIELGKQLVESVQNKKPMASPLIISAIAGTTDEVCPPDMSLYLIEQAFPKKNNIIVNHTIVDHEDHRTLGTSQLAISQVYKTLNSEK